MVIKTKRLVLRPIQIGDEKEIHEKTSGEYTCLISRDEWGRIGKNSLV